MSRLGCHDQVRLAELRRARAVYRIAFGQALPGELVDYSLLVLHEHEVHRILRRLCTNLEPPPAMG